MLPISNSWFSAFPPSKGTPSTNPSKSITAISFLATGSFSTVTNLEFLSAIWPNSCSISSSVTSYSTFSKAIPLYFPNFTSGLTCTTAVNINSWPLPICTMSISGLLTTSNLFSEISFSNISGTISLKVSS